MDFQREKIDVICQHTKDRRIIPMRIRLTDEDGVIQTYNIKSYKDVTTHGSYVMPNGIRGSLFYDSYGLSGNFLFRNIFL